MAGRTPTLRQHMMLSAPLMVTAALLAAAIVVRECGQRNTMDVVGKPLVMRAGTSATRLIGAIGEYGGILIVTIRPPEQEQIRALLGRLEVGLERTRAQEDAERASRASSKRRMAQ